MAKIRVHLMSWHGVFSHIDIMLENKSVSPTTYYYINQWSKPALGFERQLKVIAASEVIDANASDIINASSTTYVFDIESDPALIAKAWGDYYHTAAHVIDNNCAVAAQWFLSEFANVPPPSPVSAPINLNQLALALFIPNFIQVGITLPARIMDNTKFYIEAQKTPDLTAQYSNLLKQVCAAISFLTLENNLLNISAASLCLGLATNQIASTHFANALDPCGFFKPNTALEQMANQKEHSSTVSI